ncbi:MucR family transcriptional regulator [Mesorhizobium sp. ORM8.1]
MKIARGKCCHKGRALEEKAVRVLQLTCVKFSHRFGRLSADLGDRDERVLSKERFLRKPYTKPTIVRTEGRLEETQVDGHDWARAARQRSLETGNRASGAAAPQSNDIDLISITAKLVSSYVSNNALPAAELPAFLGRIHTCLRFISGEVSRMEVDDPQSFVPVKRSVTPDFIICLEDGKRLKSLKRYIAVQYGLTPDQYRRKWNLPFNYPMVAPNYSATRSRLAKSMGLGRKTK